MAECTTPNDLPCVIDALESIVAAECKVFLQTPTPSNLFIPPQAQTYNNPKFDLCSEIGKFVESTAPDSYSLLVLGDSGTGKTSLALHLCSEYLKRYKSKTSYWFPIYLNLPQICQDSNQHSSLLESFIQANWNTFCISTRGMSLDLIKATIKLKLNILYLLDSYDGLGECPNLWVANAWRKKENKVKCIILSRADAFPSLKDRKVCMKFDREVSPREYPSLEYTILRFDFTQISEYIERFVGYLKYLKANEDMLNDPETINAHFWMKIIRDTTGTDWTENSNQYLYYITTKFPELKELAITPFILTLILQILPRVSKEADMCYPNNAKRNYCFTEYQVYEEFTQQWFAYQAETIKLSTRPSDLYQLNIDSEAEHNILEEYFQVYAQNLAVYLVEKTNGLKLLDGLTEEETLKPTLSVPDSLEFQSKFSKLPDSKLFLKEENLVALRRGCLLSVSHESGSIRSYSFLHQSLVEFFASKQVFRDLRTEFDYYVNLAYPIHEILSEHEISNLQICSFNNAPLNKFPPQVMMFLATKVKGDGAFASLLEEIIVKSAEVKQLRQMAANAITLLNLAGICLSGRNFRHVHIPGANLTNSILQGTDFAFANLANVHLERACLVDVDFRGCNLLGTKFGHPSIIHPEQDPCSVSNLFAIGPPGSDAKYLCTCYIESNNFIINDIKQFETNPTLGQFEFDAKSRVVDDFVPEPVNGNIVCIIGDGDETTGEPLSKHEVHFWNLNSKAFVDGLRIPNIVDYVDRNCGQSWGSFESQLFTEFTCANMANLHYADGDLVSHLVYNLPSHNILVAFRWYCIHPIEIFPNSSVSLTLNLQFHTGIKGFGMKIGNEINFNDSGDGLGLISVLTGDNVLIYKILDNNNGWLATLPSNKSVSNRFSPNNRYFVYSDAASTHSFTLVEFDYEGGQHRVIEAGKPLGNEYDMFDLIMFNFNPSSTLLASAVITCFEAPLEIWDVRCMDAPLQVIFNVQILFEWFRCPPLFCFTSETQIACHSGQYQISLIDLQDNTNMSALGKPSRDISKLKFWYSIVLSNQFCHMATWYQNRFEIMSLERGQVALNFIDISETIYQLLIDDDCSIVLALSSAVETYCNVRLYEIGSAQCIFVRQLHGKYIRSSVVKDNVLLALFKSKHTPGSYVLYKLSIEYKSITVVQSKLIYISDHTIPTPFDPSGNWFMVPTIGCVVGTLAKKPCLDVSICRISEGQEDLNEYEDSFGLNLEPLEKTKLMENCVFASNNSLDRCKFFVISHLYLVAYELKVVDKGGPKFVPTSRAAANFPKHKSSPSGIVHVAEIGCLLFLFETDEFISVIDSTTLEELFVVRLWLKSITSVVYKYDSEAQPNLILAAYNSRNVIKFTICKESRSWRIIWCSDSCSSFVASNSNFEKSFDLSPSSQMLIRQSEGQFNSVICTNSDRRKYISLGDLTLGLMDEAEKGIGLKPIFNGSKGQSVNCTIDNNSWTVSVFVKKGKYKLPFGLYLDKSNHITLVVEGMRNGWRFICRADFTYVSPGEGQPNQVVIEANRMTSAKEMRDLAEKCKCRTHNITGSDGIILLESIMEDRTKTLEFTQFRKNCVGWCREKLKIVGIEYKTPKYFAGLSLPGILLNN